MNTKNVVESTKNVVESNDQINENSIKDGDKMKIGDFTKGKQKIVEFANLCDENYLLKHDEFKDENENLQIDYREFDSVLVEFDQSKSWASQKHFEFSLHRKFKTIGTYVTKMNKIANGVNPMSKNSYASNSTAVNVFEFSIKKIGDKNLKISKLSNENHYVTIDLENLKIEFHGDYENFEYYVTAVMLKDKWTNRLKNLMQIDENGNVCENPKFYLEFENHKFEIGDSLPNDLKSYRKQFFAKLYELDVAIDTTTMNKLQPIQFGGGQKWLYDFLCDNNLMTRKPNNRF